MRVAGRSMVVLVVLLAGCGGGSEQKASTPAPAPARPPAPVEFCSDPGDGWRKLAAGGDIDAATIGRGPAVVLLNQSDNDACAWTAAARRLAGRGYAVTVFGYADTSAASERAAARDALAVARAASGGDRFVLMGASLGGRLVFEVAARAPDGLAGIVSLSGETVVEDYRDITADVRKVEVPVLYAGTRGDPLTEGTRQPRRIRAALESRETRFVLLPGSGHGVDVVGTPRVSDAIDAFLDRLLR